jgi:hypothetical protein
MKQVHCTIDEERYMLAITNKVGFSEALRVGIDALCEGIGVEEKKLIEDQNKYSAILTIITDRLKVIKEKKDKEQLEKKKRRINLGTARYDGF